ncbi:RICIN domain-containing protein [Pseudomonas saliphila]|uniref:RICIN domain-containing protein n=1 Tax=Pseudomonas saliphila TaxID=2586906 RepID=UPI00123A5764|nr:RICIN domain-containing protein [Pseudomonas saliphila]
MIKRLGHYLKFGVSALVFSSAAHTAHAAQIDLLVLYDDYSASRMQGEPAVVMQAWQDQINTMYRNSQVDLQLRIVGVERNDFASGDMSQALTDVARSSAVAQIRDRVGADFVTQIHQSGNCGVGYLAVHPSYAFNVVGAGCGPAALAHELGHNMGLLHSRAQGDTAGVEFRYGLGHGVNGAFGTLMTYEWYYRASKMSVFSNPRTQCRGYPCGVEAGARDEADATRAINNVKDRLVAFRPTKVGGPAPDPDPTVPTDPNEPTDPTEPTDPGATVQNGNYLIKVAANGRCLNVNNSRWGMSDVVQWSCTQATNQQWTLTQLEGDFVKLASTGTQGCLNVVASSTRAGANVIAYRCSVRESQQWQLKQLDEGQFQVTARHSGLCLDAGTNANGSSLTQTSCNGSASQRFSFSGM